MSNEEMTRQHIGLLKSNYEATGNPIYVWDALNSIGSTPTLRQGQLPGWIEEYLYECARDLSLAKAGINWEVLKKLDPPAVTLPQLIGSLMMTLSPAAFSRHVLHVLGFVRRGYSAISEYRSLEQQADEYDEYIGMIEDGMSAGEAVAEIMEARGTSDERSVRRRLAQTYKRLSRASEIETDRAKDPSTLDPSRYPSGQDRGSG